MGSTKGERYPTSREETTMSGTIQRSHARAACLVPCLLVVAACHRGQPQQRVERAGAGSTASEAAGMRVYRDPQTGMFTTPPPGAAVAQPQAARVPMAPLTEVPGPRGGFVVDLQGRFDAYVTASVDSNGRVEARCSDGQPSKP
jgi:hypothetical protein